LALEVCPPEESDSRDCHLVLGGSEGIGFAYAKMRARRRGDLVLIARRLDRLQQACSELLSLGASSVDTIPGDLLDEKFRTAVLSRFDPSTFRTVFIGGPSPPIARIEEVTAANLRVAQEVCLIYPMAVLSWLTGAHSLPRAIVLSSSAATEEPCGHRFYLSAVLRRVLEQHCDCLVGLGRNRILVLRPRLVLTPLSERWGQQLLDCGHTGRDVESVLVQEFSLSTIPTADDYIADVFSRES
jgi:hypothetical protein